MLPLPPSGPLPSRHDFDPHGGNLDAQSAWRNFGGLNLTEACAKFLSAPEIYQEDFMFMGTFSFACYFPVIDRYLRTVEPAPLNLGDCEAGILGTVVAAQFDWNDAIIPADLRAEIGSLIAFIEGNVTHYAATEAEHRHILQEWRRVAGALARP